MRPGEVFDDHTTGAREKPRVLLIDHGAVDSPLARLFSRSHWKLEREPQVSKAIARLESDKFPVVLCAEADLEPTLSALESFERPPIVIVLSERPAGGDGAVALGQNVYRIDLTPGGAPMLFPLLNHAWRIRNSASG